MKKPNLFLVGAMRCGTTAMYTYLKQHPEIFMSSLKEPHFFGSDIHHTNRPINTCEEYLSLFSDVGSERIVGEASTSYLYSTNASSEIGNFCNSANIIIMLRNPIDVMYSVHGLRFYMGYENISNFMDALNAEEKRKKGLCLPDRVNILENLFYREIVKYAQQIQRYLNVFDRENVHIIIFDDFKNDTLRTYKETLRFLGVNQDFQPDFQIVNPNKYHCSKILKDFLLNPPLIVSWFSNTLIPRSLKEKLFANLRSLNTKQRSRSTMNPELKRRLQSEFATEVERLSELIGRDLTHWTKD